MQFTFASLTIRALVASDLYEAEGVDAFVNVLQQIDADQMADLGQAISSVIDWDASSSASMLVVRSGLSDELDRLRHMRDSLPAVLTKIAATLQQELNHACFESLQTVYYPQMGYLVTIKWTRSTEDIKTLAEQVGLTWVFNSKTQAYLKAPICNDLDDEIGDIANLSR